MIKEIFTNLSQTDKSYILLNFEQGLAAFVKYEGNKIIGINEPPPNINVILKDGIWYLGELNEGNSVRAPEASG